MINLYKPEKQIVASVQVRWWQKETKSLSKSTRIKIKLSFEFTIYMYETTGRPV